MNKGHKNFCIFFVGKKFSYTFAAAFDILGLLSKLSKINIAKRWQNFLLFINFVILKYCKVL
jgi:hypothetical protein